VLIPYSESHTETAHILATDQSITKRIHIADNVNWRLNNFMAQIRVQSRESCKANLNQIK